MDRTLFDATDLGFARVNQAASDLSDKEWAQFCFTRGASEIETGTARLWVPRLTLVAAIRLDRAFDILPPYEKFLLALDATSKPDWHKTISEQGLNGNLLAQSGRLAQPVQEFESEFQRVVGALGPPSEEPVADIGCGGGLWAINLAKTGYRVIGTEHHPFLVESARQNAQAHGVSGTAEFHLDDICRSELPTGLCTRAICIGVTPTLPNDAAFQGLVDHLARITEKQVESRNRRVVLGSNRWGPSRMAAVHGIIEAAKNDRQSASRRYANAFRRLSLLEACWWLQPQHLDALRQQFSSVELIGETSDKLDGTRVELLMH